MHVTVIGAGLAGSECAWQLAQRGVQVTLCEMKPEKKTPAHETEYFAELCCSNSLRSDQLENAVGLLKEELRRLGSLILSCADATRVEAGGALAVDRHGFAALVTEKIRSHPNITVVPGEVTDIPEGEVVIASGPLTSDALYMGVLDTVVALLAGLIIFPACFSFGVQPDSGPNLLFITLPNIFNTMSGGRFWGTLFFLFMVFAAVSTVIAVIENIITYVMDATGWSRKKSAAVNFVLLILLSLPCILGYNLWSGFQPLGDGTSVLDLEDFILSNNLLPLGSLVFLLFCTRHYGWGWDRFYHETTIGKGLAYPGFARTYMSYVLPVIVLVIFISGYLSFLK